MAHVLLSDVIDIIALQYDEDPDSYVHGISRTLIISHAKRVLQELGYAGMRSLRVSISEVYASGKVMLPDDYVEYVKVYYCVGNYLMPAFLNERINVSQWEGLKDFEEDVICTATGRKIYTESMDYLTVNVRSDERVKDYGSVRHDCFLKGYRYDDKNNCLVFDYIPEGVTHVAVEYVADPLLSDPNPDNLSVHKFFQKAIEAGVYSRLIDTRRNVPMNEKIRAKKEWNIKYKDAVKELNAKPWEYVQVIMGWKHMKESNLSGMGGQSGPVKKEEKYDYSLEYLDFVCQVELDEDEKKVNHIVFSAKVSKKDVEVRVEADEVLASDVKLQINPVLLTRGMQMQEKFYVLEKGEKSGTFTVSPEFYGKDANASIFSVADVVNSDEDDVYVYKVENELAIPELPDVPVNQISVVSELTTWGAKWTARSQYPVASQVGVMLNSDEIDVPMELRIPEGEDVATYNYPFIPVYGKTCDLNLFVSPNDEKFDYQLASDTIDFVTPDSLQKNDWTLSWDVKGITLFLKVDFQYPVASDVSFVRDNSVSLFTVKKGEKSASNSISQSDWGRMIEVDVYSVDSARTPYGKIEKAWDLTYVFPARKQFEVPRLVAEFTTTNKELEHFFFSNSDCLVSYGDGVVKDIRNLSGYGYNHTYTDEVESHDVVVFGFSRLIKNLTCYSCGITHLKTYGFSSLYALDNTLTSLTIVDGNRLEYLHCGDCSLQSLDTINWENIKYITCYRNQLASLDVSGCTALTNLSCAGNLLTSLDVSSCQDIKEVDLEFPDCGLPILEDQGAMVDFANTLPDRTGKESGTLRIYNETAKGWIQEICDAKNWEIKNYHE